MTTTRHWHTRLGPVTFGYTVHLHRYTGTDRRLVLKPWCYVDFGRADR